MRFSLGLSVIVSDSSCQVPPITPTIHLTRFRLFQIEITFLLGGFQVPDLASPPSGRYQRGQQEPSANSVETQTFGAKDRILFQVCFGLQIPGCHSNPKSKGGLFSVAFDCSLALGVLRLAVLYTGDHARPLILSGCSFPGPGVAQRPICQITRGEGVSKGPLRDAISSHQWTQMLASIVQMCEDGLGSGWLTAFPW